MRKRKVHPWLREPMVGANRQNSVHLEGFMSSSRIPLPSRGGLCWLIRVACEVSSLKRREVINYFEEGIHDCRAAVPLAGPTPVPASVLRAMNKPMINLGPNSELDGRVTDVLGIYQTNDLVSFRCPYRSMEGNFNSFPDKVLAISIGV